MQKTLTSMAGTGKYVRRSAEDIQLMRAFYERGHTFSEVAEEFGMTRSRVGQLFAQYRVKIRRTPISKKARAAMERKRIVLDREQLAELYLKERLSIQKVALKLQTKSHIVRSNLIAYRIPIRPISEFTTTRLTEALLRRLYIEEKMTAQAIAERLGYQLLTIRKRLHLFGIKKNGRGSVKTPDADRSKPEIQPPVRKACASPAETLEPGFYTVREIAEKYRISPGTAQRKIRNGVFPHAFRQVKDRIRRWLVPIADLENFEFRRKGRVRNPAPTAKTIEARANKARQKMRRLRGYGQAEFAEMIALHEQGLTLPEIAVRFRLEEHLIADLFEQYSRSRRRLKKKAAPLVRELKKLPEKELIRLYVEEKLPTREILQALGTNSFALQINLRRYKIPLRTSHYERAARERERVLRQLFVEENLTVEAVAERLGLGFKYVRRKLRELKIQKN